MRTPTAIVLGGTVPHRYLIEELRRRGYRTVLVDYLRHPVAAAAADEHIQASTLDEQAVLSIARQHDASLVISAAVDQANVTACYVAEELGLPAPYSSETARRIADKATMKEGLIRAGVPTARHQVVTACAGLDLHTVNLPQIVKPADANGSKGIRIVTRREDLTDALSAALSVSRNGRAIVEDVNRGVEIAAMFLLHDSQAELIYVKRHYAPTGNRSIGYYLSVGPIELDDGQRSALVSAAQAIAREFHLRNVPLLVQAHMEESALSIIEFAARIGGGLGCRDILHQTGIDLIGAALDSYLGATMTRAPRSPAAHSCAILHLYGTHGTLARVEGVSGLLATGTILEAHLHRKPGFAMVADDLASNRRVLGIILSYTSDNDLAQRIDRVSQSIRIVNTEGADVLNRDLITEVSSTSLSADRDRPCDE